MSVPSPDSDRQQVLQINGSILATTAHPLPRLSGRPLAPCSPRPLPLLIVRAPGAHAIGLAPKFTYNSLMRIISAILLLPLALLAGNAPGHAAASEATKVSVYKNPDSGLFTWTAIDDGFSVELIQLLPDFVRAIYGKYGFPDNEIEEIAAYCVFGTIIKNTSGKTLDYDVRDWRSIDAAGNETAIKTKSQWLAQWKKAGVNFAWTLLPDKGTFYAGDWQQGFTTIKFPRNSEIDLKFVWKIDGVEHVGKIRQLRCAAAAGNQ